MQDLTQILTHEEISKLREQFDPSILLGANSRAFATVYPALADWGATVGTLFYQSSVLTPRERELSLISILTHRSPGLSLGNHMYWGLMEGLTVEQICQVVGLGGCYCGLPTYTQGMFTIHTTLNVLKELSSAVDRNPSVVLAALVQAFARISL